MTSGLPPEELLHPPSSSPLGFRADFSPFSPYNTFGDQSAVPPGVLTPDETAFDEATESLCCGVALAAVASSLGVECSWRRNRTGGSG